MFKMGSHDPFGHFKHKLWPKKGVGRESNWQFDSQPLKVKTCTYFFVCRWCATYHWKYFDKGYNFISIEGLHTKLWALKVVRIPTLWISKLPKWHLGASPVAKHKIYYKGWGDGFPKSRLWWVLWVCVCPWFVRASKCSNYALTSLLFGFCRPMWISELLINLPSPIPTF
jgi:hypothetical protein